MVDDIFNDFLKKNKASSQKENIIFHFLKVTKNLQWLQVKIKKSLDTCVPTTFYEKKKKNISLFG